MLAGYTRSGGFAEAVVVFAGAPGDGGVGFLGVLFFEKSEMTNQRLQ